jgi:acetylornithine deacetylase/succinyl-diaminopimelate desuccinylase-like protein
MEQVLRYLDDHLHDALRQLQELCALPSVSARGQAIEETAAWLAEHLRSLGFQAQVLPKPEGGQPVVWAAAQGASPRTLLFYDHYDVQPEEPLEEWSSPPFQPSLRAGRLYGRGAADNKGNIVARLWAVRAWQEAGGGLPCTVKFCIEGDEEIGSPHMEELVAQHRQLLQADACLWEGGGVTWDGRPQLTLGVKGLLYVELAVRSLARDAHSSWGTVLPNAAWRLTWALNSIKGPDERVRVPGFYEAVRPPTPEELAAVEAMPAEEEETLRAYGARSFLCGLSGAEVRKRHIFEPTATIDGLLAGYGGPGPKTVLPAQALAKLDFRLVPDQDPEDILAKLKAHLQQQGFEDIEVRYLSGERPARTPIDHPLVEMARQVLRQVYGKEPVVVPSMAGTGPLYPFLAGLGLPVFDFGVGYPDSRIHAPDENVRVEDFLRGAKAVAALLGRFAQG